MSIGRLAAVLCGAMVLAGGVATAGPAMDPRQMSGIPRADPQVAPGTITVRVLDGSFDAPAVDVEVSVDVTAPNGDKASRTAKTDAQGRATIDGLEAFIGGSAIAKATRGGEVLQSQPIELFAEAGSRVMLVAAAGSAGGAPRHGDPGGPEVPLPGTAFPLEGTPAGELVVGTFDLDARKPIGNVEVTLQLTAPGGAVTTRKATSDARGKVSFDKLLPPETPAGTQLQVAAVLVAGEPERRSASFAMDDKVGMAVVLAKGEFKAAPAAAPAGPAPLPGPRIVASLPQGTVRVRLVDGKDRPVVGQTVVVVKKDQTGNDVRYDGGPYASEFFQADKRGGVAVDLRVFEITDDVSRVRSVVQFDVDGLEHDLARVVQLQDVMVTGDEAYWPPGGLRIAPAEGGKNVTVLPLSQQWLAHEESAPYADLAGPIPPGELTRLAIAYTVEHDGTAEIEFTTPLDSLETSVLVGAEQTLTANGARKTDHPSPIADKSVWIMGPRPPGAPLAFAVGGLPVRTTLFRDIALYGGLALGLVIIVAIATRPRGGARERLLARREQLLALLADIPEAQRQRRDRVIAALDRVWRQLEVLERPTKPSSGA